MFPGVFHLCGFIKSFVRVLWINPLAYVKILDCN